jgi:hypothetical protein
MYLSELLRLIIVRSTAVVRLRQLLRYRRSCLCLLMLILVMLFSVPQIDHFIAVERSCHCLGCIQGVLVDNA